MAKPLLQQVINERSDAMGDGDPNDCTREDVQYRLHVLSAVERGRADLAAGRIQQHADVLADLGRRWGQRREP